MEMDDGEEGCCAGGEQRATAAWLRGHAAFGRWFDDARRSSSKYYFISALHFNCHVQHVV
jgi:hypothetical protein